jgi:hypothetical protein
MRLLKKKRILKEIREGALKQYSENGLKLIGGPKLVSASPKLVQQTFAQMSDEELWNLLPKAMTQAVDHDTDVEMYGDIKSWFKDFWAKYGDMIIAGIKILLTLLMFVQEKYKK